MREKGADFQRRDTRQVNLDLPRLPGAASALPDEYADHPKGALSGDVVSRRLVSVKRDLG